MAKFFSSDLVSVAFKRLSSRKREGKTHLERTSALMYFLAFDAACKELGLSTLDLDPDSLEGKNNRKQVELEFTKLVLVKSTADGILQVAELGQIEFGGTSPEKRISSNFFTVPLKKASGQKDPYFYPRRPNAPLLKMGASSTGMKWGIACHENWQSNFPLLLTEIRDSTPHLDLAIFLLRDQSIDGDTIDALTALKHGLTKRFSNDVAEYFIQKIAQETLFASPTGNPFSDHYSQFADIYENESATCSSYEKMKKSELVDRILKLEGLLRDNGINF